MSMLAEPRRRKNYVLTPRGKPLYEDDSRFGSKMLQKMGWSKGKGLGAKESGETDFVRVNFKSDAVGLGFEQRDDQWTQHEHGFNGLLQSLNAQNGNVADDNDDDDEGIQTVGFGFKSEKKKDKIKVALSGESLEEKSKKSKARVHYKKFTKGKDLSQYSEKDLANIFGKKVLDIDESSKNNEKNENKQPLEDKSISITDYFKQKMEKRKKSEKNSNSDLVPAVASTQNDGVQALKESASTISDYFKRKIDERKSKRKEYNDCISTDETPGNSNPFAETHNEEPTLKKRKKDKKSTKDITEETLPETYFPVGSEKRKKKRKNEVEATLNDCKPQSTEDKCRQTEDTVTEATQKSSKSKKILTRDSDMNEVKESVTEASQKTSKSTKMNEIPDNIVSYSTPSAKNASNSDIDVQLIDNKNAKDLDDTNVCIISSFAAEKFRHTEIDSFKGSNLMHLIGYPFDKEMKLNIVKSAKDGKRIMQYWEGSLDKYQRSGQTKELVNLKTSKTNARKGAYNKKSAQKRKSAFKIGI